MMYGTPHHIKHILTYLGVHLHGLASAPVHLLVDVLELRGDVAGVAIKHGGVAVYGCVMSMLYIYVVYVVCMVYVTYPFWIWPG